MANEGFWINAGTTVMMTLIIPADHLALPRWSIDNTLRPIFQVM
jgi:hypothetical protein